MLPSSLGKKTCGFSYSSSRRRYLFGKWAPHLFKLKLYQIKIWSHFLSRDSAVLLKHVVSVRRKINVPWRRPALTVRQFIGNKWLIIRASRRGTLSTNSPWTKALDEKRAVTSLHLPAEVPSSRTSWLDPTRVIQHSFDFFIHLAQRIVASTSKLVNR